MIEVLDRTGEIAFGAPGVAAVVVGGRETGIEAQCLIVVGDGTIGIALLELDDAAIVERGGILRVELDRLVVVGDRSRASDSRHSHARCRRRHVAG